MLVWLHVSRGRFAGVAASSVATSAWVSGWVSVHADVSAQCTRMLVILDGVCGIIVELDSPGP